MKMRCVLLMLMVLASMPGAGHAGPSDGGGTNLFEDQLVDFQKFEQEFGGKQYVVNGRKLKGKGGFTPYDDVKPILDRFRYLYPDLGNVLEDTFEKDWIVLDAKFTARNTGETKAISQTGNVVYVSLPWLKRASPARVREAFTHEAIRNLAQRILVRDGLAMTLNAGVRRVLEDELTETLTPVVHRRLPGKQLEQTFRNAMERLNVRIEEEYRKMDPKPIQLSPRHSNYFNSRDDHYRVLKRLDSRKVALKLCEGMNSRTRNAGDLYIKLEERLKTIRDDIDLFDFGFYSSFGNIGFDEPIKAMKVFHDGVYNYFTFGDHSGSKQNALNSILRGCQFNPGNEKIREEARRDDYIVRDPFPRTHEEVPMDDSSSVLEAK